MNTPTPTLFDINEAVALAGMTVPVHADAQRTEIAAAERVGRIAPVLRMLILERYRNAGEYGITDKENGRWLAGVRGLPPNDGTCRYTAAPRRVELYHAGYLADSGRTRERSIVWVATDQKGDGRDARKLHTAATTKEPTP